jgi:hypothetical protein
MAKNKTSFAFLAISGKNDTIIIAEVDNDEKANKTYKIVVELSKDNPQKKYYIEDHRKGIKKRITYLDGEEIGKTKLPKNEEKIEPVDIKVLTDVFRRIPVDAVESKIVTKWKKLYYSYGYKLLIEGKFGTGFDTISPKSFEEMMQIVEYDGGKAIDESTIEKYMPQGEFNEGWTLPQYSGKEFELVKAKRIGGLFIKLYYELKKNDAIS